MSDSFVTPEVYFAFKRVGDVLLPLGEPKLRLRGLRSIVSFERGSEVPTLVHASLQDFLLDEARSKGYHIDPEEWTYIAFRHAFTLGCRSFCRSLQPHNCPQGLERSVFRFFHWHQK